MNYHISSSFLLPSVISVNMFLIKPLAVKLQLTQASLTPYSPPFSWTLSPFKLLLAIWITLPCFHFCLFWQLDLTFSPLLLNYSISPLLFWPTSITQRFHPAATQLQSAAVLIWYLWLIFGTILHILNDSNVWCYCNIMQDFIWMEPINAL